MRQMLIRSVAIGLAGSAGALARFLINTFFGRMNLRFFPFGTLFINLSGSLFLGWFLAQAAQRNIPETTRLAIGVGFVGAYTTFSTFMYESNVLINEGAQVAAITNLAGSLVLGLLAVRCGIWLARWT